MPRTQIKWTSLWRLISIALCLCMMMHAALDLLAVPRYLQNGRREYASYEFTMRRRERIKGVWPKHTDHMLVRFTHDPLRIYSTPNGCRMARMPTRKSSTTTLRQC